MNAKEELDTRMDQMGKEAMELGRNVWLAGLGAVGSVDQRGREVFEDLVTRGEKADVRVGVNVRKASEDARDRLESLGEGFERRVEQRMTRTLHLFGVPAKTDVEKLIERVEQLTVKVEKLARKS